MKAIFAIFIMLLPFFCGAADFVSHSDMEQNFALRRLLRYINGNFRTAAKSVELELYCEETVPPGEPQVSSVNGKMRIVINPLDNWQKDMPFCRKLVTLLLRAKTGNLNGDFSDLPDWFVFGISQIAAEQTSSARLIRNQHSFPLLCILAENGCFGDPSLVLDIKAETLSDEEKQFFLEYSKLIMLVLEKMRCFSRMTVLMSECRAIDRTAFNRIANGFLNGKKDPMIAQIYRRELWSDLVPPPEKLTLKCLENVFVQQIPELDSQGVPTGKVVKVRLEEFPQLAKRHDFILICRSVSAKLQTVSVGESREVRTLLADLRRIFENDIHRMTEGEPQKKDTSKKTKKSAKQQDNGKSFDELMKKSQSGDFKKHAQSFYKEKVVSDKRDSVSDRIVSGVNKMFSSRTTLDGKVIKSYVNEIYSSLERRAQIRRFIEKMDKQKRSVPQQIDFRKKIIYGGDYRHLQWIEAVSKELY